MRFELTDDQQAIQQTAREFLASRYPAEEVRRLALEDERGFTDEQWTAIAELGWPALVVAEDDGGLGLGVVELTVLQEQLGYALAPTPLQSHWAAKMVDPSFEGRGTVGYRDGDTWLVPYLDSDDAVFLGGERVDGLAGEKVEALDPTRPLFRVTASGGDSLLAPPAHAHRWSVECVSARMLGCG